MEWISVNDKLPEYNPKNTKVFSLLILAKNKRYFTGYSVTEYGSTTFHQFNGRRILNVIFWMPLSELPKPNHQ